jgi:hypothetical protein
MAMAVTQPEPHLLVVFHKPQHYLGYSSYSANFSLLSMIILFYFIYCYICPAKKPV